jgi:hypothetical protein
MPTNNMSVTSQIGEGVVNSNANIFYKMMPFVESIYQFNVKYCSMMSMYVACTTFRVFAVFQSAAIQTATI